MRASSRRGGLAGLFEDELAAQVSDHAFEPSSAPGTNLRPGASPPYYRFTALRAATVFTLFERIPVT
jgi:hypothetical protein